MRINCKEDHVEIPKSMSGWL